MAPHRQMQMVVTRFERLTRRISLSGLMSGHKAGEAIAEGRVKVDNNVATANFKVFNEALVTLDSYVVPPPDPAPKVWALYKPKKVLCSADEVQDKQTLRSLMRGWDEKTTKKMGRAQAVGLPGETIQDKHFIIVCGLSVQSDGLVVMTNDGLFAEALGRPESNILSVFDVKIAGDPPVYTLHSWRKSAHAGGINFGQVFASITTRTGTNTRLRIRYVETPERPLELLLEKAKMRVSRIRRVGFGPYFTSQLPDQGLVSVGVDPSLFPFVPKADMRQALVPTRGGILTEDGRIASVGLKDSAIVDRKNYDEAVRSAFDGPS